MNHVGTSDPETIADKYTATEKPPVVGVLIDELPTNRSIWLPVILVSIGGFFEYYQLYIPAYVTPGIVKSGLLATTTESVFDINGAGFFISSSFFGLFLSTMFLTRTADIFGRRPLLLGSLATYALGSILLSVQTTAWGLHLWRFVTGLGLGIQLVIIGTYVSELVPSRIRGRAFSISVAIQCFGMPAVAFMGWLLTPVSVFGFAGWRAVILVGALAVLPLWLARNLIPESPRWLDSKGRTSEALSIVAAMREGKLKLHEPPVHVAGARKPASIAKTKATHHMFRPPLLGRVVMMTVFQILQAISIYGFLHWAPSLFISNGVSADHSLAYAMITSLALPIGPSIGIAVADRFERKWLISFMALVIAAAGILLSHATSMAAIIGAGVVLTFSCSFFTTVFNIYQQELFPTDVRATAVGFTYAWSRLGGIINGFLIAFVLRHFGAGGVFTLIASLMVVISALIAAFGIPTKHKSIDAIE